MISYAQNFEDVLLWRCLKNIKNGFYIDVGANDPVDMSVTKWFYEQGWNGINCEPNEDCYNQLCQDRKRDINLCIGAGEKKEQKKFFLIPNDGAGLSTTEENIALEHQRKGLTVIEKNIEIDTLENICLEYVGERDIHFLKIDVEGAEGAVLNGMDFGKFRPWILVIEATLPLTTEMNIGWESYVIEQGYTFAYFDGLSRFYVANEKKELLSQFMIPVNIFDGFKQWPEVDLKNKNLRLLECKDGLEKANNELQWQITVLQNELNLIKNSKSWKFIMRIRKIKDMLKQKTNK